MSRLIKCNRRAISGEASHPKSLSEHGFLRRIGPVQHGSDGQAPGGKRRGHGRGLSRSANPHTPGRCARLAKEARRRRTMPTAHVPVPSPAPEPLASPRLRPRAVDLGVAAPCRRPWPQPIPRRRPSRRRSRRLVAQIDQRLRFESRAMTRVSSSVGAGSMLAATVTPPCAAAPNRPRPFSSPSTGRRTRGDRATSSPSRAVRRVTSSESASASRHPTPPANSLALASPLPLHAGAAGSRVRATAPACPTTRAFVDCSHTQPARRGTPNTTSGGRPPHRSRSGALTPDS